MSEHTTFLRLAATSVDFQLDAHEAATLHKHLQGCDACRHTAESLRGDAAALRSLPRRAPSPHIAAAIARAARGEARSGRSPLLMLSLGFLLVAGLAGAVIGGAAIREALESDTPAPTPGPTDPAVVPSPTASAPGAAEELVFEADVDGTSSIFRIDVGSGQVVRLTDGASPDWSPDGSRIAFAREDQGDLQIWVMDRDGNGLRTLGQGLGPVWSPDGSKIAFSRSPIDAGDLLVMDADGSRGTPLTGGSDFAWSPDSTRIATVTGSAQPDLVVVEADGSGSNRLAAGQYPAWSPDGSRIAFVSWSEQPEIQTIDPESRNTSTIAQEISDPYGPVWSPDGTRIAFISLGGDLFVAPAEGGDPARLTSGLQTAYAPAWSPDGTWIAFTVQTLAPEAVASDIWLVRADGTDARPLTTTGNARRPSWRPVAPSEPPIAEPSPTPDPRLGVEWQLVTPEGLSHAVEAVAAGGPGFVAVGRPADGGCEGPTDQPDPEQCWGGAWISSDGITWQEAPRQAALEIGAYFPTSGPGVDMIGVAAGPDTIVAIGYAMSGAPTIDAGGELRPAVWTSTDGLQWERVADESIFERARFSDVAATEEGFVIVGAVYGVEQPLQGEPRGAIWTSVDGREWERVPDGPIFDIGGYVDTGEDPASGGPRRVTLAGSSILSVGSVCNDEGLDCVTAFWSSPDGSTWERVVLEEPNVSASDIAAAADGFVAVGIASNTGGCGVDLRCTAAVFTSPDGRSWQRQQIEVPEGLIAPDSFSDVVVVGGRIIAIGEEQEPDGLAESQAPGADALWSSADGRLWTPLEGVAADFDADAYWQPIASGPDRIVIIGRVAFDPEETRVLISPPR